MYVERRGELPHVVLRGDLSLDDFFRVFMPLYEEKQGWSIKIEELYLERNKHRSILPAIVVEEGHLQSFYIRLSINPDTNRLTARLDPATDPIKTKGVKRSVALVAESLLDCFSAVEIWRHNLEGYLQIP